MSGSFLQPLFSSFSAIFVNLVLPWVAVPCVLAILMWLFDIFGNYLRCKLFCLVTGACSMMLYRTYMTALANGGAEMGTFSSNAWWFAILAVSVSWCFFIGPTVTHEYWDGKSWNIFRRSNGYRASPKTNGGLMGTYVLATIVFTVLYVWLGSAPFGEKIAAGVGYIIPIVIMGLSILGFLWKLLLRRR